MPNILVTNDDGIYSQGIFTLCEELSAVGTLLVAAPDSERSSVGHGITLDRPIWYKEVLRKGRFFGYGISGTPADCVKLGVEVLATTAPDLIISGINIGNNDGCSVFYSGTVAGAREGAMSGIPSMAVSLATFVNPDFRFAARFAAHLAGLILENGLPRGTFLNVNVPNQPRERIRGVKVTRQGTEPIQTRFEKRLDPSRREYYWMTGEPAPGDGDLNNDTAALLHDYITITPIHSDLTDNPTLEKLAGWGVDLP